MPYSGGIPRTVLIQAGDSNRPSAWLIGRKNENRKQKPELDVASEGQRGYKQTSNRVAISQV